MRAEEKRETFLRRNPNKRITKCISKIEYSTTLLGIYFLVVILKMCYNYKNIKSAAFPSQMHDFDLQGGASFGM